MISIVVICENPIDLEKISSIVSVHHDFQISASGTDGYDALRLAETLKPGVMIMDMNLAGFDAAKLAPMLKRKSPDTALIVLCNPDQSRHAGRAISAGIAAYLLKQEDMDKLEVCIRLVCSGGYYVSISTLRQLLSSTPLLRYFPGQLEREDAGFRHNYTPCTLFLASSERRIIMLITQGLSNDKIAKRLGLKEGTVRNYLTRIKHKTGTKNRIEIAFYALIHGLIHFEQIGIFRTYISILEPPR